MTSKELQEILSFKRKELHLTHQDVADLSKTGITRQYYGFIENGKRRPSVEVAKGIARVLELNWTIFFELNSNHTLRNKNSA